MIPTLDPNYIIFEVPSIEFSGPALKIEITCWMRIKSHECFTRPGYTAGSGEKLAGLVIHYDEETARKSLGEHVHGVDLSRWKNLLEPDGYYKVWRLEYRP